MRGPYSAILSGKKKIIRYNGNDLSDSLKNVKDHAFIEDVTKNRLDDIFNHSEKYYHLHRIDQGLFSAAVSFFQGIGAEWCNLPLTTLMISSPGEVYAGKNLDYTTDTLPVDISWFDIPRKIFLSESSQFYLELRLLTPKIEKVFSIYNSFRKEHADFCHLSEFQHIEFEGKVSFEENIEIFISLVRSVTDYLVRHERQSLVYFIGEDGVEELEKSFLSESIAIITFEEALKILYHETHDVRYQEFSLKHFSSWEEIKLTEICQKHVIVTNFPLLQIPFYHNEVAINRDGIPIAENADFIFFGYREVVGSGTRIFSPDALREKARVFNLPEYDYDPYIRTRLQAGYRKTSGFGMGWQRYVQWILQLPFIWDATHIPRGHHLPRP